MFLEQYIAYILCANWLLLPCVVLVSGGLWLVCAVSKLGFPRTGYLRDFQGQYYSLILILYKFCAVSISLLCGDGTVSVIYEYVYTVLFGIICLFLARQPPPSPPVG